MQIKYNTFIYIRIRINVTMFSHDKLNMTLKLINIYMDMENITFTLFLICMKYSGKLVKAKEP